MRPCIQELCIHELCIQEPCIQEPYIQELCILELCIQELCIQEPWQERLLTSSLLQEQDEAVYPGGCVSRSYGRRGS